MTNSLFSQELKLSKDPYEFIPKGSEVYLFDFNKNGIYETYWWDKNKDGKAQDDEIFIDLNEDGIPDCTFKEYDDWYKKQEEKKLIHDSG